MEIKLEQKDKKLFKTIGLFIFFIFWIWVLFFYGKYKPGLYEIRLKSAYINGADFKKDVFNEPLPIYLYVYKDGKEVFRKGLGRLRGKKEFDRIYFKLTMSNKSKYSIKIEETSIVSQALSWTIPGDQQKDWMFNRKVHWGKEDGRHSYVEFEAKYLE
jgi:hypothetical protein